MYLGATLLDVQALRKAAENFRVLIFPLFLTTLFITPIYCLVYRRRKYAKILLVVQNLKIALKKLFEPSAFRDALIIGNIASKGKI